MFPNFTWHGSPMIRLWQPRGPDKTEVWTYCIVDKQAPQEVKNSLRKSLTFLMGPSGNMDQDDMNNWLQCTTISRSLQARKRPINQQLGLGRERKHEVIPGTVAPAPCEMNQRAFYGRWAEVMDAPSWSNITLAPRTKF
jgi:3-phenylpropionate/trans-cinnamate dioxygenase alpha subunit